MRILNTKQLAASGLMAALVFVGTMIIQIPSPTRGYIHAGDSMVYLCGIILGPVAGGLAAAIGSVLADLFSGYGIYAPATFFIKGLDALIIGYCFSALTQKSDPWDKKLPVLVLGVFLGGGIMITGYLGYETFLYGYAVALAGVIGNITQAVGGGVLALPLFLILDKMNILEK